MGHPFSFIAVQNALLPLTDFIEDPTVLCAVGELVGMKDLIPPQPKRDQRYSVGGVAIYPANSQRTDTK